LASKRRHCATFSNAECLIDNKNLEPSSALYINFIDYYKKGMHDMQGRAAGNTMNSVLHLSKFKENGHQIPFNKKFVVFTIK
jgi:hypothetical protein